MNDFFSTTMLSALGVGLLLGPILWWAVTEAFRQLAWRLEFGRGWIPNPEKQDLGCVTCGTNLLPDDTACSGCGKSREIAFLGSLREVEIASEQLLRLNRQGAVDPLSSSRVENALNRQRSILSRLRRPQKVAANPAVELILPDEPGKRTGYIDPDTFYESYHPGAHPLRLQAVTQETDDDIPQGTLQRTARLGGLVLLAVSFATFFHGAFPPGASTIRFPGMAECWTGLAFLLGALYTLAFGRGSAPLAHTASVGTACLIPLFWICVPWIHGASIAPVDWALALVCASLCHCAAALIDRHLIDRHLLYNHFLADPDRFDPASQGDVLDRSLLWCSGVFLAGLQLGALAGLAKPDSWFGPWTWVAGQSWGLLALSCHCVSTLALKGPRSGFSLPGWIFEGAFGLVVAIACAVAAVNPLWGASVLGIGMAILTVFVSLLLCHLIPAIPRLLKPTFHVAGPWVIRTLIILFAVALAQRKGADPHPWIGATATLASGLAVVWLGGQAASGLTLLLGLLGTALATGLISRQIMAEMHHDMLEQFWLALGGFALGAAFCPWLARLSEWTAHPKRLARQSATHWLRMVSVQILLAGGLAATILALVKKTPGEVHFWANPATAVAWLAALVSIGQIRSLRGHGFGLLALSGAILTWGLVDKTSSRGSLAIQTGLGFLGAWGLFLSLGAGRLRSIHRRLSKVSVSWAAILCSVHLVGTWALLLSGRDAPSLPMAQIILLFPGFAGCLTWMSLARNRNLPGLAWIGAIWLVSAFLPMGWTDLTSPAPLLLALLAALAIALLCWNAIASQYQIPRRFPLGIPLAWAVGFTACALSACLPERHHLLVLGSSLLVLAQSRRLVPAGILAAILAVTWGAMAVSLARFLAGALGWEPSLALCFGLGLWVAGSSLGGWLQSNWAQWTSNSRSLDRAIAWGVCASALLAAWGALALAAVTDDLLLRVVLSTAPFLMSLCLLCDANREKRSYLAALALGLGFWGWLGIALSLFGPGSSGRLAWFLAAEGCLAALAFLGLGRAARTETDGVHLGLEATRKALRIFAAALAVISLLLLIMLKSSASLGAIPAGGALVLGMVTATLLAGAFLIEAVRTGLQAGRSLNLVEIRRLPYLQEFQAHGTVLSGFLGLVLCGLWVLEGAFATRLEFALQAAMAAAALFAAVARAERLRWLARPLAWQCLLMLSLSALWNLATWLAIRLEGRPAGWWDVQSDPSGLLLRASLFLAMVAVFLEQCRPGASVETGRGLHPFECFAWLGATLAVPAILMQQQLVSAAIWQEAATFLIVPVFGWIALWSRRSRQSAATWAQESFWQAEPLGKDGNGSGRLSA